LSKPILFRPQLRQRCFMRNFLRFELHPYLVHFLTVNLRGLGNAHVVPRDLRSFVGLRQLALHPPDFLNCRTRLARTITRVFAPRIGFLRHATQLIFASA
jgi:hypothetical protein|tara:strand:+ start:560 stop:859 length:300 start_codon:yes stop_codon:yes gene_type:complete